MNNVKYINPKNGRVEVVKVFSGNTQGMYGIGKHTRTSKPTVAQANAIAKHNGLIRIGTRKNKGRRNDFNT